VAVGAEPWLIQRIFLSKALLLGLIGGVGGDVIGTIFAVTLGPKLAGVPVLPMPGLALWALVIAVGVALAASFIPAWRPSQLDPVATFRET
jgi:putative ABC transport system permease protein